MIYLLQLRDKDVTYQAAGFVIIAPDEPTARKIADADDDDPRSPWLDPDHSSCEELRDGLNPRIVLRDFRTE